MMARQTTLATHPTLPDRGDLSVAVYAQYAEKTDRLKKSDKLLDLPFLGLFGEVGGVLTEAKKPSREDRLNETYQKAIREEFGDALWYFAALCRRLKLSLEDIFREAIPELTSKRSALRFSDLQKPFLHLETHDANERLSHLISLAASIGAIALTYQTTRPSKDQSGVACKLVDAARLLFEAASASGADMQTVAVENIEKILSRWPIDKNYPLLLDRNDNPMEQLPRKLRIEIFERAVGSKIQVFQRCNHINIGDPLTDNKEDPDDYRFHDVFHYAYAAKLGWSPVTRALFKLKRKSDPNKDENQDGARAILIEEGIASWVFEQALRQDLFDDIKRGELSYNLLKTVQQFTAGYEVENQPLWLWEEAILSGFECFRFLKTHRQGVVEVNLEMRTLTVHDRNK